MSTRQKRFFGYRTWRPESETIKRFYTAGVDTFTLTFSNGFTAAGMPYTLYQPIWLGEHQYDFNMVDKQFAYYLNVAPDAKIIALIDLNTPMWWHKFGMGVRYDSVFQLGRVCASEKWRNDTVDYFQALLKHIEEKYSEHMEAYIYGCGSGTEWFDMSQGVESPSRYKAYCKWCKAHGKTVPADLPQRSVREQCSGDLVKLFDPFVADQPEEERCTGLLRIPEKDSAGLDFHKFNSELMADTVLFFAKKAREVIRKDVQLGTLFGYMLDISFVVSIGQLDYERVFNAEELDFFVAPATYNERQMGGGSGSMIAMETLHLLGKRMLNSCDHRTFTTRTLTNYDRGITIWKDGIEVTAGMKREFAMNFIYGASLWWFDMLGGWWDSQEAMDTIKKSKAIWDTYMQNDSPGAAEIFVVCDPENVYYLNEQTREIVNFTTKITQALNHTGVPFVCGSFNDLEKLRPDQYKLFIFQHPFELNEKKMEILRKCVMKSGKTALWLYGPGIIKDRKWQPENVKKICGTTFKTSGINTVKMDAWNSVYVADSSDITPKIMKDIAKKANVHIWCDKQRPVYANKHFAAVHTGEAEKLTLLFPEKCELITELYTGEKYTKTDCVELETTGPSTFLFKWDINSAK